MNKYLFITHNNDAYVFEEENDESAAKIVASYLDEHDLGWMEVSLFMRITGGLRVESVKTRKKLGANEPLTSRVCGEIGWERLSLNKTIITQLQPFSKDVREKRLLAVHGIKKTEGRVVPKVGDDIYVPLALYMDHGRDDRMGGLAKVVSVSYGMSGGKKVHNIRVEEFPDCVFCWEYCLAEKQDELRERFGRNRAYSEPDIRPQFNDW